MDTERTNKRINELVKNLTDLFIPHLADVIDYDSFELSDEEKEQFEELAEQAELEFLPSLSKEDEEDVMHAVLRPIAKTIVVQWLRMLAKSAQNKTIDSFSLDDRMLPSGTVQTNFSNMLGDNLTENQAYEVLRLVRSGLPMGYPLPDDAEAALKLQWNIVVL